MSKISQIIRESWDMQDLNNFRNVICTNTQAHISLDKLTPLVNYFITLYANSHT